MTALRRRLADERGWALVTSLLVLGIMLSLALPLMTMVDTQQQASSQERRHEGSFNLAEAVLNAQVFVLSGDWPTTATESWPASCTEGSTSLKCPAPAAIADSYSGVDYAARRWAVLVRDDGAAAADFYDPDVVAAQPAWDANGNGRLWVSAEARGAGRDRGVVAQVQMDAQVELFPRNVVTAGYFTLSGKAKRGAVDTQGTAAQPAPLAVRCTTPARSTCLNYDPRRGQVSPDTSQLGYSGDALSAAALDRLRLRAKSLGTYYSDCPRSPVGELVFVEAGDCVYGGGKRTDWGGRSRKRAEANAQLTPGAFVVARGTVGFTDKLTYYGLVYAANQQASSGIVLSISKSARIQGAVAVDGGGGVSGSASRRNLVFDERVYPMLKSFTAAGVVQGTWREL